MGRRVGGIEAFKLPVAAADLGVGVAVLVDQEIVEDAAKVGAQTDAGSFPIGIVGEEMRLFAGQAEGGEFRGEVVDVRLRQQRPVMADVAAERLGVGEEELPERGLLFRCRPDPQFLKRGMIGIRPALDPLATGGKTGGWPGGRGRQRSFGEGRTFEWSKWTCAKRAGCDTEFSNSLLTAQAEESPGDARGDRNGKFLVVAREGEGSGDFRP